MAPKRGIRRPRGTHRAFLPSTYIKRIDEIEPGTKVVLWCRVSSGPQDANGNNADQEADIRAAVDARGGTVVCVVAHEGRVADADAALHRAAQVAAQYGAVLLAESVSRIVRHPRYHPKLRPHLTTTPNALRDLRPLCGDVPLVTLLDPDATWREERAHQSKRGQRRKGRTGGRPTKKLPGYRKRFRLRSLPKVRWMKWVGMSDRAIAKALGTDKRNVGRWGGAFSGHRRAGQDEWSPRNPHTTP